MRALSALLLVGCAWASPVTFSNLTSTNHTPTGLAPMSFSLVEEGTLPDERVVLRVDGPTYGLQGGPVFMLVSQTLTVDFTLEAGYTLRGVVVNGNLGFDGTSAVSEGITLDAPCHVASLGPCLLDTPLTSGTLSITLFITSNGCVGCHGFGTVGPATAYLLLDGGEVIAGVPEPSYFILAGIAVLLMAVVMWGRRRP